MFSVLLLTTAGWGASGDERRIGRPSSGGELGDVSGVKVGNYWGLFIGIDDYTHVRPKLETAVADARAVCRLLQEKYGFGGDRTIELYNGDATRQNILAKLNELVRKVSPDDAVLIYYAGHGDLLYKGRSILEINKSDEQKEARKAGVGFWIPVDAHMGRTDEYIANSELRTTYLSQLDIRHLLVISDSCYSGGITQRSLDPSLPPPSLRDAMQSQSRLLLASGGLHPVPDSSHLKQCIDHSTFACYLLKYLGESSDPYMPVRNLYARLYEPVVSNSRQDPQLANFDGIGHENGQFVFILAGGPGPETGSLRVESQPAGAGVWVDGRSVGKATVVLAKQKSGRVSVRAGGVAGYTDREESVYIQGGRETRVVLNLDRQTQGGISVESRPSGGRWYLDGGYVGETPGDMKDVAEGRHDVVVKKEGYSDWRGEVQVMAGKPAKVVAELKKAGPVARDIWKDPVTGMEFVWVPSGSFDMGSPDGETGRSSDEGPVHRVEVDGFWMGKTEVTVGQYMPFAQESGQNPVWKEAGNEYNIQTGFDDQYKKFGSALTSENYPVVGVSWDNAKAFAQWMSGKTGKTFRLPSEAQWEYASRGGKTTARFWGNNPADACRYANVDDGSHKCSDGYKYTSPVGSFQPNPFGLFDMLGNVREWVEDVYIADIYGRPDKKNPMYTGGGSNRVIRGGSWSDVPDHVRCALRGNTVPADRRYYIGFRLLMIL